MKRMLLALALTAALCGPTFAQQQPSQGTQQQQGPGGRHRGGHRGRRLHRLLEQLNLSEDQRAQIRSIMQSGDDQTPRERMQRIMAVLTPEQRSQLQALREQYRQQHEGGPGGQGPRGPEGPGGPDGGPDGDGPPPQNP